MLFHLFCFVLFGPNVDDLLGLSFRLTFFLLGRASSSLRGLRLDEPSCFASDLGRRPTNERTAAFNRRAGRETFERATTTTLQKTKQQRPINDSTSRSLPLSSRTVAAENDSSTTTTTTEKMLKTASRLQRWYRWVHLKFNSRDLYGSIRL